MYARTVSIALIAAIIACPMRCGNGLCHAGECCPEEQSSQQSCPTHGTEQCCCDKGSSGSKDDGPCDLPCESSCQGVCGGAIFEKPLELNDELDSFLLPHIAGETPVACQLAESRYHDGDHLLHCGGNHGRSLRTLHMSFLC